MADRVLSHPRRRRDVVSLSQPSSSGEPVEQLDRAMEILHRVNRALPETVPDREELIALGGLLTQISDALLCLTDLLILAVHRHDHIRTPSKHAEAITQRHDDVAQRHDAVALLYDCHRSYLAARGAARAFHASLKH